MAKRLGYASVFIAALVAYSGGAASLEGQTLTLAAGTTSQTVPSPTAAIYNAASPGNVTGPNTTTNFSTKVTCATNGNPGCQLDLAFGTNPIGGQLQVQWQLVSFTGANCPALTTGGPFKSIPVTAIVSMTKHGDTCTLTFAFQVAGLSYATQPAPGPGGIAGPYAQNIVFTVH